MIAKSSTSNKILIDQLDSENDFPAIKVGYPCILASRIDRYFLLSSLAVCASRVVVKRKKDPSLR